MCDHKYATCTININGDKYEGYIHNINLPIVNEEFDVVKINPTVCGTAKIIMNKKDIKRLTMSTYNEIHNSRVKNSIIYKKRDFKYSSNKWFNNFL